MPTTSHARRLARVAATAALAATVIVGPLALSSSAANYTADSEATWRAALADALANTGETNTITLTGDFVIDSPAGLTPTYTGVSHSLIIDGNGHTVSAAPGNLAAFLSVSAVNGSITLSDLTLAGFQSDSAASIDVSGNVELLNVTVRDFDGSTSALYLIADNVTIEDSTFTDNVGAGDGGALGIPCFARVEIEDSTFSGNSSAGDGGAVESFGRTYILNSTFTGNSAIYDGGAIYVTDDLHVEDSVFSSNTAGGDGGAVLSYYDSSFETSTFTDNEALNDGGAVYVDEGYFRSRSSTFSSNTAGNFGGGVYAYYYAVIFESTWVGNQAAYGGAIYTVNDDDYSMAQTSTFIDNSASVAGGAIYAEAYYVEVYNSVFTGNGAGTDGSHVYVSEFVPYATVFDGAVGADGCYADYGTYSTGYNFDDDGTCTGDWGETGDIGNGADPMLGALADNGGPTRTRHPLPGSPLIDAIPWVDCDVLARDSHDQRFVERVDTGADVDGCDIGSVEVITDLSFDIVGSSGTTTVTVTGALDYDCDAWTPIAGYVPAPPAGIAFPHGVFQYCFYVPINGDTVTITLTLPSPVNTLWKETGGVWSEVTGVVFAGTTVTYSVTDGGALDEDGIVNGYIIDPIAAGRRAGFTG